VAELLISRDSPGVATVRSVDLFDTLVIYRVERAHWQKTPQKPGIYRKSDPSKAIVQYSPSYGRH